MHEADNTDSKLAPILGNVGCLLTEEHAKGTTSARIKVQIQFVL